jgi:hypothetical protein
MQLTTLRTLAAAAAIALLAAACGSTGNSSSTASGNSGSPPPKSLVSAAYRNARCMREHGFPNFPDPKVINDGGRQAISIMIPGGVGTSPRFEAARRACHGILPPPGNESSAESAAVQHVRAEHLVSFARCMRAHGVANFPDPTAQGQLTLAMLSAANVDIQLRSVQQAAYACAPSSGGSVTPAAIHQAISGGSASSSSNAAGSSS